MKTKVLAKVKISNHVANLNHSKTAKEIASTLKMNENTVRKELGAMVHFSNPTPYQMAYDENKRKCKKSGHTAGRYMNWAIVPTEDRIVVSN